MRCAAPDSGETGHPRLRRSIFPDSPSLIVFAAASLTNALQEVGDAFTKQYSIAVKFSFAASSALARQIENAAPADVFFSADGLPARQASMQRYCTA
jgi:ABC-type molybdate transport system substrate-binding protein